MFFDKCLFLSDSQKDKLENDVRCICKYANQMFMANELCVALFLSGSLARREPTYKIENNKITLASDLDFVLIYDENINSYKSISEVIKKIKDKFNYYDCSFSLIERGQLMQTTSF